MLPTPLLLILFIVQGFRFQQAQKECEPGHGGPSCNISCPDNCITCSDHATCSTCKAGYYNGRQFDNINYPEVLDCSLKCGQNCTSCSKFGTCTECKRGYFGIICDQKCSSNCAICASTDKCTACVTGFYNRKYSCYHCISNCLSCRDPFYCRTCNSGFYDYRCHRKCEIGCLSEECYIRSGRCLCKDNFTGYRCDRCVTGRYGKLCNFTCPNCICDRDTGQCTSCNNGYFLSNTTCVSCEKGTWGQDCKNNCSEKCVECSPENGICTVCSDGKYANDCSQSCSTNCMTRNNVPVCAAENGACLKGCSTLDKHGVFCNLTCGSNCKDGTCDWKSGACLHGCTINYFGEFCENMCSISCAPSSDRRCFSRNGTCIEGCFPGYYGPKCLLKCNDNCLNNVCGREKGHCSHGCIQGFTGDTCTYITHSAKQKDNTKSSTDTGAIIGAGIGGAAGMLVIVGGILLIVFCLRGRVRNKENSNSSDPTGERNDDESAPGYAEEARVAAGNGVGNTAAETYQNVQESVTVNTNMYEQLQDRDKSGQQYEMVSTTIYQNTSR